MIRKLTTGAELDAIFLHPEVSAPLGLPADWSGQLVLDRGCRAWGFDGGAFIVSPQEDGTCQVHVGVLPEARGIRAVRAARAAIAWEISQGTTLVGRTPIDRPDALCFALAAGMRFLGQEGDEWVTGARG